MDFEIENEIHTDVLVTSNRPKIYNDSDFSFMKKNSTHVD